MTIPVGLVNYGRSGNLYNVKKALELAGARVTVVEKEPDFHGVDRLVLPGVGCFRDAMEQMGDFRDILTDHMRTMPTLGICLGMQILAKTGYEYGETPGLNLIEAEIKRIEVKCKVPHLGWGSLEIVKDSPLLEGITSQDNFYFMHSYEMINFTDVIALTRFCDHKFVSMVQKNEIFGVQFHPEKSRTAGIRVLKNFLNL
ncbi:imidazole glycerol phosphate synthase subunit HisH [Methanoregula sp.]|uniref:imidazole glycerol phosphate synthase subunit HisH n=1 Tax=Methanoregula sp. TaxID=2052170 RepID=UPI0035630DE3